MAIWLLFIPGANCQYNEVIQGITSICYEPSFPPQHAIDNNMGTYYLVHPNGSCHGSGNNVNLNITLKRKIKAATIRIRADNHGIRVSVGNILNYHTTMYADEVIYVVKPDQFQTISLYLPGYWEVYEISIAELDFNAISLPFVYDNAGNMTYRTILLGNLKSSAAAAPPPSELAHKENEEPAVEEILSFGDIVIYPNPTRGELRIETSYSGVTQPEGTITVYSISGRLILNKKYNTSEATINIADQPPGAYILVLTINGKAHRWNIIKE